LRVPSGIEVIAGAELTTLGGSPGRFIAHLSVGGDDVTVRCDAVVLADDAPDSRPRMDGMVGVEAALTGELPTPLRNVAIVLGPAASRDDHARSLELARGLRARPDRPKVTLFTKELLAHGKVELSYAEAQRAGVRIVRTEGHPEVAKCPPLKVSAVDHPSGLEVELCPDLLIGAGMPDAHAIVPDPSPRPGPISMGPASSTREGVFLCGAGRRDLLDDEITTEARAAATRALTLALAPIARDQYAAQVDRDRC
jgi:hypothetical protein